MDELNLGNLCRGAALEQFEKLLPEILANIKNPNTSPKAVRTLKLEFRFKPNEDRNYAEVEIVPSLKMAGMSAAKGSIFISNAQGKVRGHAHDPRQDEIAFSEPPSGIRN